MSPRSEAAGLREYVLDNAPSAGETRGQRAAGRSASGRRSSFQGTRMTSRLPLGLAALALMAACAAPTPPPRPVGAAATASPEDRLVAAIESEGCVMTGENVGAVLLRANLTQAELASLVAGLQSRGRIEASSDASLRILSDNCI